MGIQVIDVMNAGNLGCGSLIGSTASDSLLHSLKSKFNSSYNNVNDIFQQEKKLFVNRFVNPIRKAITTIKNVTRELVCSDAVKPIIDEKGLSNIPHCMHESILLYKPVYELLKEERIFGFGYDVGDLRVDDPYERMIDNGLCEGVDFKLEHNLDVECISIWKDDDPDITLKEIDYIAETRDYINTILKDTRFDPTDYPNNRG